MKRYSRSEPIVFAWIGVPYIFFMNVLIFGWCMFQSVGTFLLIFFSNALYFFLIYTFFGSVAVGIKNKYSTGADLFKRIRIMLPVFYVLNILAIYLNCYLFTNLIHLGCTPHPDMIWWTILYGCIMSTLITFINEGIANWESWKNSLSEGEKLKNAYQRSKLLGLKGQLNPHFLFNCFNTLSGLIDENTEKAETFLNEMTKVHRYLLRGDDEKLVKLGEEIRFAKSYLYLTKERFGEAINTEVSVSVKDAELKIPPLSLQVILENIIYTNTMSKKNPLYIYIEALEGTNLRIIHNVSDKIIVQTIDEDEGLDNLVSKYKLLGGKEITIIESEKSRELVVPLFNNEPQVV